MTIEQNEIEQYPPNFAAGSTGICVTFHGRQRKSTGSIRAEDQAFMLEQSIRRLLLLERFPVIISTVVGSPAEFPLGSARAAMYRLWNQHRWITTTSDLGHQQGALQSILNGVEAAHSMGLEWLLVTAEDVLFESANPVRDLFNAAQEHNVDYYAKPWLDSLGIKAVSTQVFMMRIRALFDPARNWRPWRREYCNGYCGIEHYTLQTLLNHKIPYRRADELRYFHTHDIRKFREFLEKHELPSPSSDPSPRQLVPSESY